MSLEIGSFFSVQVIDYANSKHLQTLCRLKTKLAREFMRSLVFCVENPTCDDMLYVYFMYINVLYYYELNNPIRKAIWVFLNYKVE